MSNTQKELPEWFDGKKINEILFCEAFRKKHPMICINGRFFTVDGLIADPGKLEAEIFNTIKYFVHHHRNRTFSYPLESPVPMEMFANFYMERQGEHWGFLSASGVKEFDF